MFDIAFLLNLAGQPIQNHNNATTSDTYIGTKGEEVYLYANVFGGLLRAGVITDFIELETDGDGDGLLAQLFANKQSNIQIYGTCTVFPFCQMTSMEATIKDS